MHFDEHFLKGVIPESAVLYDHVPKDVQFSIDTRTIRPGEIFIALSGAKQDGHDFLQHAISNGAAGFIIQKKNQSLLEIFDVAVLKKLCVIVVHDTLQALMRMARAWRAQFKYPVIGVTGSVGKTSTKELIASICRTNNMSCITSHANQNTRIGLSLNILRMRKSHQVAIFELGSSMRGEMAKLAELLRPTSGIIINVGHSHMEGIGSLQDIAQEKRALFKYLTEESIGIVNGDQPLLANVGYVHPVIKFGSKTVNQIQARKIHASANGISFILKIYREKFAIHLSQPHMGSVFNALAAAAVTHLLGVPTSVIARSVSQLVAVPGRFEERCIKNKRGVLINDAYNANPESMKTSLMAFQQLDKKGQKIAVIADMLELGVNSPFWHRQLGRFLRKVPSLKRVILVGNMVEWTKKTLPVGLPIEHVSDWQQAVECLDRCLSKDSVVFVKGSRGMQLNKLVNEVCE